MRPALLWPLVFGQVRLLAASVVHSVKVFALSRSLAQTNDYLMHELSEVLRRVGVQSLDLSSYRMSN